jgi:hypothetical protein
MKRFVDLRQAAIPGYRFAWWDTVVDKFESHGGNMAWETWDEFCEDFQNFLGDDIQRYKALAPKWTYEPEPE